jgi:hypothetical protein
MLVDVGGSMLVSPKGDMILSPKKAVSIVDDHWQLKTWRLGTT